jgi:hypothetical protein
MNYLKKLAFAALMVLPAAAFAAEPSAKLYRNPNCACCDQYADYLKKNGFEVEVVDDYDGVQMKEQNRIPEHLYGCHTMKVGPYVFEGLIPLESIQKVLAERPFIKGLSVPGMPMGAPGMPGMKREPLKVYSLSFRADAPLSVYASH